MITLVVFLCFIFNIYIANAGVVPQNIVTVPPNCPEGQEWINGQCRDVWRVTAAPINLVTVPTNCPPGQEFINGQCRDVWYLILNELNRVGETQIENENLDIDHKNVINVPTNCNPGQQWVNGQCRDIWRSGVPQSESFKNVIQVPTNCAPGEVFINGQCREVWRSLGDVLLSRILRQVEGVYVPQDQDRSFKNVISVPNQCPIGFRPDALGRCREIFN